MFGLEKLYSERIQEIMAIEFLANPVSKYLAAIIIFTSLTMVFYIFRTIILGKLKKISQLSSTKFDDILVSAFEKTNRIFYYSISLYFALHSLNTHERFEAFLDAALIAIIIFQIIISSQSVIAYFLKKLLKSESEYESSTAIHGIQLIINIILWTIGLLMILANLGINITSLAASLGIGGVAIALAVQNILGDIFSSFSIYFDKPFIIGDFIIVGEHMGTVEKIGLKTTRIRALQGEEIVISNQELTSTRIQNFKRMNQRRVEFSLGVTYSTKLEQCKQIPKIMQKIFDELPELSLDRTTFREFGDFSLIFEVVYFQESRDYNQYMLSREELNLKIKEEFEKAEIEMAFPTQTLFINREA